jgi:hypothetical protein
LFADEGVEPRTDDLTLDEIFAAFVTGRPQLDLFLPSTQTSPGGGVW